ncbi:MAG: hypothetical protein AAGH53_13985 [Pseudomonadota bacterium]
MADSSNVGFGWVKTLGVAAFIFSALAVSAIDARFEITEVPLLTGFFGGIIGWGIANTGPGAGGGVVALSGIALILVIFSLQ